jgi:phosphatidylglycerol---prolipoprotein diacylglyceryl transferase
MGPPLAEGETREDCTTDGGELESGTTPVLDVHFVFETLAYVLGFRLFLSLRRRRGDTVPEPTRMTVLAGAAVGAAVGSKLLALLQHASRGAAQPDVAWLFGSGKSVVGGLLGGLVGVELTKRWVGEERSTGDLFVLPLCLGIAVGRIGCFLAGLRDGTYGTPTDLPWAVDFGDGIPRHPTQLYEITVLALIAAWAWRRQDAAARRGDLFRGFMVLYLGFRFFVELIKPDPRAYAGLSAIQAACLCGLVYYARDLPRVFAPREVATDGG